MVRPACILILLWPFVVHSMYAADPSSVPPPDFGRQVLPVLQSRCGTCHGECEQEAGVRFDTLSVDFSNRAAAQTWLDARNAIHAGDMPPEDETPLSNDERSVVLRWIDSAREAEIRRQRDTGGRRVMRRLNRVEYQNTMFDLLGLDMNYARDLPPDSRSPDGFRNDGQSLRISAQQLEYYLATARLALSRVIVSGPPPQVFRHQFLRSNVGGWRGPTEKSNRLERAQKFLAKIVDAYPEQGAFKIHVTTRAELRAEKGFPILEVSVGYRPDTEVHFGVAGVKEVVSEDLQRFEFSGRMENFPLPVRGQGKYPGLVIRLRNIYSDGTAIPSKLEDVGTGKQKRKAFRPEPQLPNLQIESVAFEAPVYATWPPALHRRILFESELRDTHEVEYIRQVLQRFMSRAYRRPATRSEVEAMFAHFAKIRPDYTSFEDAMRETLAMVLIQPSFLFHLEPATQSKQPVTDWELATRLSYFLWSTMPDEPLTKLADAGLLHQPPVLRGEVDRMLTDPRAQHFVHDFVHQWLQLDNVDNVAVDARTYPRFDEPLKKLAKQETTQFFAELLRRDEPATQLVRSEFTMMNETLARHYGITGLLGNRFQRVQLQNPDARGGLLGHAGILLANSNGQDSHPIRRAVWIRDRLLGDPPAPPPPDVPELDESNPEFATRSVREQLEVHRNKESCAACHRNLDPWGIALENFDAVGRWRDTIHDKPVVVADTLGNGQTISGPKELRELLLTERRQDFAEAFVRRLLTYALGRTLELADEEEVNDLVDKFDNDGLKIRSLIHRIASSKAFQSK